MKNLFLITALVALTFSAAEAKTSMALCSVIYAKKVVPVAEAHSTFDKNRHCSVSCMLTLRCPSGDVLAAGALKEVKDMVGPGNAEMEDMKADILGIELAVSGAAKTDGQCLAQCDLYYSP